MSLSKALTAAAGNAGESLYVEDVFSTYLYTGNGTSQTITNGIDLDGEGGMVWIKNRDNGARHHALFDTERGATKAIYSNQTWAEGTNAGYLNAFNSGGFSVGNVAEVNGSGEGIASWSFRKAEKFFDVQTWTGTGGARTLSHNLGSTPSVIIVKSTTNSAFWCVYHSSLGATKYLQLSSTDAAATASSIWNDTAPTSTEFTVGAYINQSQTYVAYLFASDAGGFGDDGSENIIKCGSFTTDGNATPQDINLGFEPQFFMYKRTDSSGNWFMADTMRGWTAQNTSGESAETYLYANLSATEASPNTWGSSPNATGINWRATGLTTNSNYIYVAIRRPMKTPAAGTEVLDIVTRTATNPNLFATALSYVDVAFNRNLGAAQTQVTSRLTGGSYLHTASTAAEVSPASGQIEYDYNYKINPYWWGFSAEVDWLFKRATGFMDVVAYTGNGAVRTIPHNLGVAPEMMLFKIRNQVSNWQVYASGMGPTKSNRLNNDGAPVTATAYFNDTAPTSSVFTLGTSGNMNWSGNTFISYHFATLAGVSKVGSYTGTGSNVDVDCGFSAGARFILIKRTDSTGDWYVYDSVRGIVAGNDPYLLLNSSAAQVTNTDYIDPLSSGFTVTSSAPAALNASGGTYIFLAIA